MQKIFKKYLAVIGMLGALIVAVMSIAVVLVKTDKTKPTITISSPKVRKKMKDVERLNDVDVVTSTDNRTITLKGKMSDNIRLKSLTYKIKNCDRFSADYFTYKTIKEGKLSSKKKWELRDIPLVYLSTIVELTVTDWNQNKRLLSIDIINMDEKLAWEEDQAAVKDDVLLFNKKESALVSSKKIRSSNGPWDDKGIDKHTYDVKKDCLLEQLYQEGKLKIGTAIYTPEGFGFPGYKGALLYREELPDRIRFIFLDSKAEDVFKKNWHVK